MPSIVVSQWSVAWPLDVTACLACATYVWAARGRRRGWPAARTAAFVGAVGSILVALQSGLAAYDDRLLSAHMVQHLILLVPAPVLLLVGRPVSLALATLPPAPRRRLVRGLEAGRCATSPAIALAVFAAVVLGTHLPGFYDAALRHPALHEIEHAAYLGSALLLWWPVVGDEPSPSRRLNGFLQLAYVIAAMLPMEAVGAFLSRDPSLVYRSYAAPAHGLGVSAVVDQQHAGAIMWVLGGTLMVAIVLWTAVRAMQEEERRLQARERHAAEAAVANLPADRGPR
jgi:putative copper resistance protein D